MKKILAVFGLIVFFLSFTPPTAKADVYVNGYFKSNGTYVEPYWRSDPDGNPYNNYSFPGNYNPYTGQIAPGNPETYLEDHGYYRGYSTPTFDNYDYSYTPSYSYSDYSSPYDSGGGDYSYDNSGY